MHTQYSKADYLASSSSSKSSRTTAIMDANPGKIRRTLSIVPAATLATQPWWPQTSRSNHRSLSRQGQRMSQPSHQTGQRLCGRAGGSRAEGLSSELGDRGHLAVVYWNTSQPIACGGVLPYRGDSWIRRCAEVEKADADIANAANSDLILTHWRNATAELGGLLLLRLACAPRTRNQPPPPRLPSRSSSKLVEPSVCMQATQRWRPGISGRAWDSKSYLKLAAVLRKGFKIHRGEGGAEG